MAVISLIKYIARMLPRAMQAELRQHYRAFRDTLGVWSTGRKDAGWYCRFSGLAARPNRGILQARIIKSYHRIEKGLALTNPRPGFGNDAIATLIEDILAYRQKFGCDYVTSRALQTLAEYDRFNTDAGQPTNALAAASDKHGPVANDPIEGGTIEVTRAAIHQAGRRDLEAFFRSRYSIRQFSSTPVEEELIEHAVKMAQKTPSVCNRESGRVFLVSGKHDIARLLTFQNGNRGFGDQADKLLIVTASADCFLTVGERHQAWIDGGMFAMSLIYALHSLGLGTCCLNWSVEPNTDQAFKEASRIPEGQAIVMLVVIGHIPDQLRVAASARRPLGEVLFRL
ncbi:nitroreductase family protein [Accumulibacter sp.]|uniref:nitroreductase family protein n=1 Tax=Accumulibacter sp. TaxID=2053492 RepID=UPI0035B1E157